MKSDLSALSVLSALTALAAPAALSAQVRASEPATVSQTVDGTKLTVTYSRPRDRSRDSLFGKVVTWGEVWTPGANQATTLELSKDIRLNGNPVPKGKYSVWMVVRKNEPWTFVLDPKAERFHTDHPDSTREQIRFLVKPEQRPYLQTLTWSFPEIRPTGARMTMQWGTTVVPVDIEVEPSYRLASSRADGEPYLGEYEWRWSFAPDSAKPARFIISYADGMLRGRWDPGPFPGFPEYDTPVLIRIKDDWFITAYLDSKGELLEVMKELVLEFKRVNGRAVGLDLRGEDDKVMASAKRKG